MALTQLSPPFPIFTDRTGRPLDGGYLYFGEVDQDPETAPITVYFDSDLTQPAVQPLRTSAGYVMRDNAPALLYAASRFSVTVKDKQERLVIYAPSTFGLFDETGLLFAENNLSDVDDADTAIQNIGGANLLGLKGVTAAANKLPYATSPTEWAVTDLTPFARTLLDDADAETMRTTLELNTKPLVVVAASASFIMDGSTTSSNEIFVQLADNLTLRKGSWQVICSASMQYFGTVSSPGATRALIFVELRLAGTSTVINGVTFSGDNIVHYPLQDAHYIRSDATEAYTFASDTAVDIYLRCFTISADAGDDFQTTAGDALIVPVDVVPPL